MDSGTGSLSLPWGLSLNTNSLTAITGSKSYFEDLKKEFKLSKNQDLIIGNWENKALLKGKYFDTILADYLLGAVDGFAPYFQTQLLSRLKCHLKASGSLYFIGLEPFPDYSKNKGISIILSNDKSTEVLLFLTAQRQISKALKLAGISDNTESIGWVSFGTVSTDFLRVVEEDDSVISISQFDYTKFADDIDASLENQLKQKIIMTRTATLPVQPR